MKLLNIAVLAACLVGQSLLAEPGKFVIVNDLDRPVTVTIPGQAPIQIQAKQSSRALAAVNEIAWNDGTSNYKYNINDQPGQRSNFFNIYEGGKFMHNFLGYKKEGGGPQKEEGAFKINNRSKNTLYFVIAFKSKDRRLSLKAGESSPLISTNNEPIVYITWGLGQSSVENMVSFDTNSPQPLKDRKNFVNVYDNGDYTQNFSGKESAKRNALRSKGQEMVR
jgi:hypothetical protein